MSAGSDCWGTPLALFGALHTEFAFTVDGAANEENHLLPRWFGPGSLAEDGLAAPWVGERVYVNPPFSNVQEWVAKSWRESQAGALVVMLIKVATGRRDWHRYIWPGASEVRFVNGRLSYRRPEGAVGATFDSAVVVFQPFCVGRPLVRACDRQGRIIEPTRPELLVAA